MLISKRCVEDRSAITRPNYAASLLAKVLLPPLHTFVFWYESNVQLSVHPSARRITAARSSLYPHQQRPLKSTFRSRAVLLAGPGTSAGRPSAPRRAGHHIEGVMRVATDGMLGPPSVPHSVMDREQFKGPAWASSSPVRLAEKPAWLVRGSPNPVCRLWPACLPPCCSMATGAMELVRATRLVPSMSLWLTDRKSVWGRSCPGESG